MIEFVRDTQTVSFFDDEITLELTRVAEEEHCASKSATKVARYGEVRSALIATIRAVRDDSIERAIQLASGSWWTVDLPGIGSVDVLPDRIEINDTVAASGERVFGVSAEVRAWLI